MISEKSGQFLLKFARKVLEKHVKGKEINKPEEYPKELDRKYGIFCTLNKNENLRGCIGLPYPKKSLIDGTIEAVKSSTKDPRFPPLEKEELKKIKIELSILSKMQETNIEDIKKGDGTVIEMNDKSALFLPQVWKKLPDKEEFMSQLCLKAGLNKNSWRKKNVKFHKFHVKIFEE